MATCHSGVDLCLVTGTGGFFFTSETEATLYCVTIRDATWARGFHGSTTKWLPCACDCCSSGSGVVSHGSLSCAQAPPPHSLALVLDEAYFQVCSAATG